MGDLEASIEARNRQHAEGCVKTWEDLDRYRVVIGAVEPDLIIECGTFSGKSALWFARTAGCRVVTIDVTPYIDPDTREAWDAHDITLLVGSTLSNDILTRVHRIAIEAERVLVVLDSDHSRDHVLEEMHAYGPMVTPDSYLVVEDTLLHWFPAAERDVYDGDPLEAVQQFLAETAEDGGELTNAVVWELDLDIEDLHPVTQFPNGWLRRR